MFYNIKMYDFDNKSAIISIYDGIHYDNEAERFIIKGKEYQKNLLQCGFNIIDARGNEVFLGDVVSYNNNLYVVNFNYQKKKFVLEGLKNKKDIKQITGTEFYYCGNALQYKTFDRINRLFKVPFYLYKKIFKFTLFSYRYSESKSYVAMNGLIKLKELIDYDELQQLININIYK